MQTDRRQQVPRRFHTTGQRRFRKQCKQIQTVLSSKATNLPPRAPHVRLLYSKTAVTRVRWTGPGVREDAQAFAEVTRKNVQEKDPVKAGIRNTGTSGDVEGSLGCPKTVC